MIKLVDQLSPMGSFPVAEAKDINFSDNESLQDKYDNGELGGSNADYSFETLDLLKEYVTTSTSAYPGQLLYDKSTGILYKVNQDKTDVDAVGSGSGAIIDDTTASDTTVYSSNKVDDLILQATGTSNSKIIVCADAVNTVDLASDRYQYLLADYTIHKVTEGIDVDVTDEVYVNIIRIEEAQYDALPDEEKNKDYTWYVT